MKALRRSVIKLAIFAVVAVTVTVSVVATLLDLKLGQPQGSYQALFTNASGLQSGDTVRVAGIEVGKVKSVALKGYQAEVGFTAASSQHLTTTTKVSTPFQNLLGQRYLSLDPGPPGGAPLKSGATIPISRTNPGLDLTTVFTGFQPLLAALNPTQVNQLTGSIIAVLQGQSGSVANLTAKTAQLTNNLAQRSDVINQVLDNLGPLLTKVNTSDGQIGQLIDSFDAVVKGLAAEKPQLDGAITGASSLTANLSNLLDRANGPSPNNYVDQALSNLVTATAVLQRNEVPLSNVLRDLTPFLKTLNRVSDSGSYLSVYVCDLTINVSGPISINLSDPVYPGAPPSNPPVQVPQGPPLTLNAGVIGNRVVHFPGCGR